MARIQEVGLIPVLCSLLQLIAYGFSEIHVDCYDCVWQPSSLESGGKSDHCLPSNFRKDLVNVVRCTQGCFITSMFEESVDIPLSQKSGGGNGSRSVVTEKRPPLSFFRRGCPNGDNTRKTTGCEEKSVLNVYREECFCTSNLCNQGAAPKSINILAPIILAIVIIVFSSWAKQL